MVSGQIGLNPTSMMLVSGALSQAITALEHVQSVLKACHTSFSAALYGMCYYSTDEGGSSAKQALAGYKVTSMCRTRICFNRARCVQVMTCVEIEAIQGDRAIHSYFCCCSGFMFMWCTLFADLILGILECLLQCGV